MRKPPGFGEGSTIPRWYGLVSHRHPADPRTFQAVLRRIPQLTTPLSPVLAKAWRLLARAAQERAHEDAGAGWLVLHRIKNADIDHSVREGVSEIVRPRLGLEIPFASPSTAKPDPTDPLKELLQVTFEPRNHPTVQEILSNWPASRDELLFNHAERALASALDEAADAGYLAGLDRASYGVKWVGSSGFGLLDAGFTPIVRLVTELWTQIADQDPERAAVLASRWSGSARLLLIRLYLHVLSDSKVYPGPAVPAAAVAGLDDHNFWVNDSTREIAHLFLARWSDFPEADRDALEERIRAGPPRHLLRQDERRHRPSLANGLGPAHLSASRAPQEGGIAPHRRLLTAACRDWRALSRRCSVAAVRSDSLAGISLHWAAWYPAVLTELPDDQIVATALRIRQSDWLRHGDVWRQFCKANPQQALQAILAANGDDRWRPEVISPLLEVARETDDAELQAGIGDLLADLSPDRVIDVAAAAAWWVWERAKRSPSSDGDGILRAWDHLARVVYAPADSDALQIAGMTVDAAFASPGGMLAIALGALTSKRAWPTDAGFAEPFLSRLDIVAASQSRAGLQGRIILVRDLAFLEAVDPAWVSRQLTPRLRWTHAEASPLWRALAARHIGRPSLFVPLIDDFLEAMQRADPDENIDGLAWNLFHISRWAIDQPLSISASLLPKVRTALAVAVPKLRERTAWVLRARMLGEKGETFDRAERWGGEVGPVFRHIWPLDATARDPDTSRNLVFMALECGDAFPDAVEAIRLVVVPYEIVTISGWLQGQPSHQEATTGHPGAFVRLVNALLSSDRAALPPDLGTVLGECLAAEPSVRSDPAFVRLDALRRRSAT